MPFLILLSALSAIIIFGASPVAAKLAVGSIPPIDVALLRTILGGAVAWPLALLLRIGLPRQREQQMLLTLSGFCGFVGFPVFFTLGVNLTSANHASMILACLPVMTGGIAMVWDRQSPSGRWLIGCLIALAGEVLLITFLGRSDAGSSLLGDALVLLSNLFAALGYVSGGRLQRSGYSAKGTTFWGVTLFAVLMIPVAPLLISGDTIIEATPIAWAGVIYLAIGVTIVGYILWYWALGSGGIARTGLLQFFQPVSGVILASILLGEKLSAGFGIASGIIFAGVWLALS